MTQPTSDPHKSPATPDLSGAYAPVSESTYEQGYRQGVIRERKKNETTVGILIGSLVLVVLGLGGALLYMMNQKRPINVLQTESDVPEQTQPNTEPTQPNINVTITEPPASDTGPPSADTPTDSAASETTPGANPPQAVSPPENEPVPAAPSRSIPSEIVPTESSANGSGAEASTQDVPSAESNANAPESTAPATAQ